MNLSAWAPMLVAGFLIGGGLLILAVVARKVSEGLRSRSRPGAVTPRGWRYYHRLSRQLFSALVALLALYVAIVAVALMPSVPWMIPCIIAAVAAGFVIVRLMRPPAEPTQ